MEAKIIKLNREIAKEMLKNNVGNRKIRPGVKFLINQMKNGEWKENGEAIIIDKNGIVKDGQHRLTAVVATGFSYNVPVIYDVEPDVMDTIDTGFNRSLGDVLQFNGFKYSNLCAAIIKSIMAYDYERYDLGRSSKDRSTKNYISNSRGLNFGISNKSRIENLSAVVYNSIYHKQIINVLSTSEIGLYLYIIGGFEYKIEHINFVKRIAGIDSIEGTAAYWVFKKLASYKKDHVSVSKKWKIYALIKAWNIFVNGDIPVNRLSININNKADKILKYNG